MSGRDLDALIGAMPTHELEEYLMRNEIDRSPNRIENDLKYQDARREGDHSTRGSVNLGESGGYPICDPNDIPARSSWWLVAVATVLVTLAVKVVL